MDLVKSDTPFTDCINSHTTREFNLVRHDHFQDPLYSDGLVKIGFINLFQRCYSKFFSPMKTRMDNISQEDPRF